MKNSGTSGGTTGRLPAVERDGGGAGLDGDGPSAVGGDVDAGLAAGTAFACFLGAISVWICSRVSGPRKYESAQRVWKTLGWSSCTLFIRKTRLPRLERSSSIFR